MSEREFRNPESLTAYVVTVSMEMVVMASTEAEARRVIKDDLPQMPEKPMLAVRKISTIEEAPKGWVKSVPYGIYAGWTQLRDILPKSNVSE